MPQNHHEMPGLSWFQMSCLALGSCLLLFVLAPLLGLLLHSSAADLAEAAHDAEVIDSIKMTLLTGLAGTLVCAIGGVPLAYLLARKQFVGRAAVLAIINLPLIIPHAAAGIALLTVFGRRSLTGGVLEKLHVEVVGTPVGIALAMAFVSVPFLINAAHEAFEAVPERLEKVARTLGASHTRMFFTISLPLAWRGICSGMVLMWARGISEFGAVIIIAYHPMTTPVLVFQRLNDYGLRQARAVAVVLVLVCVPVFLFLRLLSRPRRLDRRADA